MAIHPIDLSTIYTQLDKVAKYNASQNQNTQIASAMNQEQVAQTNQQKAKGVEATHENQETDSAKIKDQAKGQDGDGNGDEAGKKSRNGQDFKSQEELAKRIIKIKDPRLGNYVDVRR